MARKIIYVAHPLRGNIQHNRARIEGIMRDIFETYGDKMTFISPLHNFSYTTPDQGDNDEKTIAQCLHLLNQCDELWLYGEWDKSEGCLAEFTRAMHRGINIEFKDPEAQISLRFIGEKIRTPDRTARPAAKRTAS